MTDRSVLERENVAEQAREVVRTGGPAVALHIRGPALPGRRIYDLVCELIAPARAAGAQLLVNDRVDVALTAGADGVHLGWRSLPVQAARRLLGSQALIGRSTHAAEAAAQAESAGSDYVFVGAIFPSTTHPHVAPAGTALISDCVQRLRIPVIAIGGIDPPRVADVRNAGAHGVAVIAGVWGAGSVAEAVKEYLNALGVEG